MTVPALELSEDFASGDVESRKEGRRSVTDVAVGHSLDVAQSQRQEWLGPVKRLDLALLIDAQDQSLIRWVEIQTDDVSDLLDEEGIRGELEVLLPVRLDAKRLPDALDGGLGELGLLGDRATAPVSLVLGFRLEGLSDETRDLLIRERPGTPRTRLIVETLDPLEQESASPHTDGWSREIQLLCDGLIGPSFGCEKDDACPVGQGSGHGSGPRHGAQSVLFKG